MKRKLLSLAVALLTTVGMWAYTTTNLTSDGWTLVSSLTDITDNVYVFVDAGSSNYAVARSSENITYKPIYQSLADPFITPGEVWTIESRSDGYAIRNAESQYYFNSGSAGWDDSMADTYDTGSFTFTLNGTKYDIKGVSSAGYVGPWNNDGSVASDSENIAANKTSAQAPGFYVYKMAKATYALKYMQAFPNLTAPVDMSFLIVNPTIYQSNNDTNKLPTGWSKYVQTTGNSHFTEAGSGNTQLEAWHWTSDLNADYYQQVENLPAGKYAATAYVHSRDAAVGNVYIWNETNGKAKSDSPEAGNDKYADRTTAYLVIPNNGSANVGMEVSGTATWFTADNFRLQADPYVSTLATALPDDGSMEAGLWYYFTVVNDGTYNLAGTTNLSDIIYTTGSTTTLGDAISAGSTFSSSQVLSAGTYYVRSSSANCLAPNADVYTAVTTAVSTIEGTLGFEDGEYAPYANVTMITGALATAKNITESNYTDYSSITLQDLVFGLLKSSNWNANDGEVNAIFWDYSDLAENTDKGEPLGWDLAGSSSSDPYYNTRIVKNVASNAGLNAVDGKYALFTKTHTNYGLIDGYTLPLKAKAYKLTFKYGAWNEPSTTSIYLTDPSGNRINISGTFSPAETDGYSVAEHWYDYVGYFVAPTTGDYVIYLNRDDLVSPLVQRQLVMGNIELKSTSTLPIGAEHYAPGTYPHVTLSRTFKNDHWNTICLPFAVSASDIEGQFSEVKELSSITVNGENVSMKFADASAMAAGKPYLVKTEEDDVTTVTATNVAISASPTVSNTVVTDDDSNYTVTYVGTFSGASLNGDDNANAWVVSNSLLYNVNSNVSVGAYRGYFTVDAVGGSVKGLSLGFDDLETAIEAIDNGDSKMDGDAIYNLAGQRVQKATKGLYIINGKKVMVK